MRIQTMLIVPNMCACPHVDLCRNHTLSTPYPHATIRTVRTPNSEDDELPHFGHGNRSKYTHNWKAQCCSFGEGMATNCLQSVLAVNASNRRLVLERRLSKSNVARSNVAVGALNFGGPLTWNVKAKVQASLFPFFLKKKKDRQILKEELFEAIAPLDRGAEATPDDRYQVDRIVRELEMVNPTKDPLGSKLLNGKWELLYTTSETILKRQRPKFLRPNGPIYQAINTDTLRAQNLETWPFFNQVTANLTPIDGRRVAVKFDTFKIGGLVNIKAPGRARGELEITYLDDELRISRGDKGNLFVLRIVDPTYRVPL